MIGVLALLVIGFGASFILLFYAMETLPMGSLMEYGRETKICFLRNILKDPFKPNFHLKLGFYYLTNLPC